jgi:predicted AlkP superfamily pyrophosphatase or phosphodiesterase
MIRSFVVGLLLAATVAARPAAPPSERTVILVSIDGMRWDYLDLHAPPRLQQLAREGVRAERLNPTFPTKTFPNHYTLVTGLRVEHHGVVGNDMFDPETGRVFRLSDRSAVADPRWWGGEPIWVTAERQGRRSACLFWPGSETEIKGIRPTHWRHYDEKLPLPERIAQVLAWLDLPVEQRPAIITLYFAQVDDAGHRHGPEAAATRQALHDVDAQLGALVDGIFARGLEDRVHVVLASDHGMAPVSPERLVFLDDAIALDRVQIDFTGPIAGLRPLEHSTDACVAALRGLPHVRVVRKTELSPQLGYSRHPRAPEVLVIADEGWRVLTRRGWETRANKDDGGDHGYDSAYGSMGATFVAWGAAFRRGERIQAMDNVHLYELLCATLGLTPAPNDGDRRLADAVLVR